MNSIRADILMKTNDPIGPGEGAEIPQHWQRLSAKIAQVGDRIAREIHKKLVASGVDPRSLDNPEGTIDELAWEKERQSRRGGKQPGYRSIG